MGNHRMRKVWKRFCSQTRGQAIVETALTVPFLFILLVGAFELARVAYVANEVESSARAAAQYGAMAGGAYDTTDSTGLDSAGMLAAAQNDTDLGAGVTFVSGYPTYTCTCSGTGTTSCSVTTIPTGCTTSHLVVTIQVQTQATFKPVFSLPVLPSYTVYGMSYEEVLN